MTPTGMLWNTESYTVVEAVEEEVMDAARAAHFELLDLRITVKTKGLLEWWVTHGDTLTSLNSTQIEICANAVVDYVTNWENACDKPALAADYMTQLRHILLHYRVDYCCEPKEYSKPTRKPEATLKFHRLCISRQHPSPCLSYSHTVY